MPTSDRMGGMAVFRGPHGGRRVHELPKIDRRGAGDLVLEEDLQHPKYRDIPS
jgi:hypothetical protein